LVGAETYHVFDGPMALMVTPEAGLTNVHVMPALFAIPSCPVKKVSKTLSTITVE